MKREAGRESVQDKYSISINPPVERQPPSQRPSCDVSCVCDARRLKEQIDLWIYEEEMNLRLQPDPITEAVRDTLLTVLRMIDNNTTKKGGTDGSQNDKFAR